MNDRKPRVLRHLTDVDLEGLIARRCAPLEARLAVIEAKPDSKVSLAPPMPPAGSRQSPWWRRALHVFSVLCVIVAILAALPQRTLSQVYGFFPPPGTNWSGVLGFLTWSGNSGTGTNDGQSLFLNGGNGGPTSGEGGEISLNAGNGEGTGSAPSDGASVLFNSGSGSQNGATGSGVGGSIQFTGGNGCGYSGGAGTCTHADAANISFIAGNGGVTTGAAGTTADGGGIQFTCGSAGTAATATFGTIAFNASANLSGSIACTDGGWMIGNGAEADEGPGTLNAQNGLYSAGIKLNPPGTGTSASIGGSAVSAGACTSGTGTVSGTSTAMGIIATPVSYPGDGFVWEAYRSASGGVITVKVCNFTSGSLTPSASAYNLRVIQ